MNSIRIASALVLGSLAPVSTPAAAAPRDDMTVYTACVMKHAADDARLLLDTAVRSAEETKIASRIVNNNRRCIYDTDLPTIETGALRGRLAEAMISEDNARLDVLRSAAPAPAKTPAKGEGRELLAAISECLAAANPEVALRMIRTPRGSFAEREALEAFGDTTKICTPADTKFRLEVADVRNHVADALYRRSGAGSGATAGAAE